jgi:SH3 domain protein
VIFSHIQEGMKQMNRLQLILAFTLGFCWVAQPGWAAKAYVSDSFQITLRTGPGIDHKIIAMPLSGQPLEVLGSEGDWSLVRLPKPGGDSVEGWVLSRYLSTRLPWKAQATSLEAENASLKERLDRTEKELSEATGRERSLARELKEHTGALQKVQAEYNSLERRSADYLKLESEYKQNRSTLETTQAEVERLTEEVNRLRSSQRNRWFLSGALVLLFGLIIGLLIGRQQRKRRSSYY